MPRSPWFERAERLLGPAGLERLGAATVAVFGLGGVGSFCAEALARSGVGALRLVDHDRVTPPDCNRQLCATRSTLGETKVEAMRARLLDIAPDLRVDTRPAFFSEETAEELLGGSLSFVVDAIDSLGPKVSLLGHCRSRGLPVITALGAGGRVDPTKIRVVPLALTRGDRLGMWTRKRLRKTGTLAGLMAVCSEEPARPTKGEDWPPMTADLCRGRQRQIQPSLVMVPAAMGMAAAGHVIARLSGITVDSARETGQASVGGFPMTLNQANDWIRAQGAHFTMNDVEVSLSLRGHTVRRPRGGKLEKTVAELISELEQALTG
jgi:tRNA A37 threonylcarbamoyladenosine dehydratase